MSAIGDSHVRPPMAVQRHRIPNTRGSIVDRSSSLIPESETHLGGLRLVLASLTIIVAHQRSVLRHPTSRYGVNSGLRLHRADAFGYCY